MRILTVDVGTGTQDILLFDADREMENCFKMVMPAPTVAIAEEIRAATARGDTLVLRGRIMGGGPCHWAARDHLLAGFPAYVTPDAARTFDDDPRQVRAMGAEIVSEDEADALERQGARTIVLRDFWLDQILAGFSQFGLRPKLDGIAIAVFDHGNAPPGVSDRAFRFEYLRERLGTEHRLPAFAFPRDSVPASMTRLQAAVQSAPGDLPVVGMDTAPAAVLGALDDPAVGARENLLVVNVGNFHTLAFHLTEGGKVAGLFEHHTGEMSLEGFRRDVDRLSRGTIRNEDVFRDKGHGALVLDQRAALPTCLAVTGPRRAMAVEAGLRPYFAVPHGDMMLAGNVGLLRAWAWHRPSDAEAIEARLGMVPAKAVAPSLAGEPG